LATKPRLQDVAALAEVDASVVSRVLSGDRRLSIREETRQRVLDAVAELGYRRNTAARALKTARTMAIGMIVPDFENLNYARIVEGAEHHALSAGYVLLVAGGSVTDKLPDLHGRVDGLLVGMATSDTPRRGVFEEFPAVLVNRRESWGMPSVTVDDAAGARLGCRYLLDLGHRRIGHIAGPSNADVSRRRHLGYVEALDQAGVERRPEWVVEATFDEVGGHVSALDLLRLPADVRPTAIFVSNVRASLGAMAAARQVGLAIPKDLSIVALHDLSFVAYLDPPLTTVRMPLVELGRRASDKLLKVLAGRTVDDEMILTSPELIVRGSTAPPAAHG
jgi:LacI family transcriptional regulator